MVGYPSDSLASCQSGHTDV